MSVSNSRSNVQIKECLKNSQYLFPKITRKDKIKTEQFLMACEAIITIVSKLGKGFAAVKFDMNRNVARIAEKYREEPTEFAYLEDMVLDEQKRGLNLATESIQWLRRELQFIARFFQCILIDEEEGLKVSNDLSKYLKKAYEETLEKLHGWLGFQLLSILQRSSISRREFYHILNGGRNNKDRNVVEELKVLTERIVEYIEHLEDFYYCNNLERQVQ